MCCTVPYGTVLHATAVTRCSLQRPATEIGGNDFEIGNLLKSIRKKQLLLTLEDIGVQYPSVEAEDLAHPPVLPVLPHGEWISLAEDRKTTCEAWEVEPERVTEVVALLATRSLSKGSREIPERVFLNSFSGGQGQGQGEQERGRG